MTRRAALESGHEELQRSDDLATSESHRRDPAPDRPCGPAGALPCVHTGCVIEALRDTDGTLCAFRWDR